MEIVEKKGVSIAYTKTIKDIYNDVMIRVKTPRRLTEIFPILHQESTLKSIFFLHQLCMNSLDTSNTRYDGALFVDDIVLINETRKVNAKFKSQ